MNKLTEEEVYNGTKSILKENGFMILAGQPPKGVDHLPVVEIKSGTNYEKGSKDAYKPDLLAYKSGKFYIVECKPLYDVGDVEKLTEVLSSGLRLECLYNELELRKILKKINYTESINVFKNSNIGTLAYSGQYQENNDFCHIVVEDFLGTGKIIDKRK